MVKILKVADLAFLVSRGGTVHQQIFLIELSEKLREIKKKINGEARADKAFPPKSTNYICVNKAVADLRGVHPLRSKIFSTLCNFLEILAKFYVGTP